MASGLFVVETDTLAVSIVTQQKPSRLWTNIWRRFMVYKANRGWAYSHTCTDKHKHVEGPFATEQDADIALRVHVEKCDD
jgi:hypothetical protein